MKGPGPKVLSYGIVYMCQESGPTPSPHSVGSGGRGKKFTIPDVFEKRVLQTAVWSTLAAPSALRCYDFRGLAVVRKASQIQGISQSSDPSGRQRP